MPLCLKIKLIWIKERKKEKGQFQKLSVNKAFYLLFLLIYNICWFLKNNVRTMQIGASRQLPISLGGDGCPKPPYIEIRPLPGLKFDVGEMKNPS